MNIQENKESDLGTPETRKHGGGVTISGNGRNESKVAKVNHQSPIDYYHKKELLTDKQWAAAEKLRRDAYISGKFAYVKSSCDFSITGHREEFAEIIAEANKRFYDALRWLLDYEEYVIIVIIINEQYINSIRDYKIRLCGMELLRSALDTLIKYYRI